MDFIWILVAFCFGLLAKQLSMPPMIGFLAAGFFLHALGVESSELIEQLGSLGITLLLFTIGLKLDLKALFNRAVLGTSLLHSSTWILLCGSLLLIPFWLGISYAFSVDYKTSALIAFALSFSSTVGVVKVLEESSELKALHGRIALGILIIQDILAVVFLVASTGKVPSEWALALLLLPLARPVLFFIFQRSGHGELLPLLGFFLALGGYELFELVGVKGDLGALVIGILVAGHSKSSELYKALMSFKEIFLIGFFLSIGLTALPTLEMMPVVLALTLLLVLKSLLFFFILVLMRVSGRVSYLAALALSNYSEFGLIVADVGAKEGLLSPDWLVIIAISMSLSFLACSLLYRRAHYIYADYHDFINRFERTGAHQTFQVPDCAEVLIAGMGRVGKGAYQALERENTEGIFGLESDLERAKTLSKEGLHVIAGDSDDLEFWQRASQSNIRLVMLALPNQDEMRATLRMISLSGYQGKVAAVARYEDDRQELLELGVDIAFNYYLEVGSGFAAECQHLLDELDAKQAQQQA